VRSHPRPSGVGEIGVVAPDAHGSRHRANEGASRVRQRASPTQHFRSFKHRLRNRNRFRESRAPENYVNFYFLGSSPRLLIHGPKGLNHLAQGFNPGNHQVGRFALKRREITIHLAFAGEVRFPRVETLIIIDNAVNGGYLRTSLGGANKYRLEAYATLLSGLAREVWKSSSKRFRVPVATRATRPERASQNIKIQWLWYVRINMVVFDFDRMATAHILSCPSLPLQKTPTGRGATGGLRVASPAFLALWQYCSFSLHS
jgi:hypothetical protein